jgi:DivIVA domain-containing protein
VVPLLLLALVAVALVVAVLGVASGRIVVDPLSEPVHTAPDPGLPETPAAADVDGVRFDTALRGYRMDDVDARLDALREDLADRERTLALLPVPPARQRAEPPEGG